MDSKSSPSLSSSKKTVEGVRGDEVVKVGRNEVVGVEGDSVPITVVEVEGKIKRGYDVDADIVEEVKQYKSEIKTRDSLGHLVENYKISSQVLVRPAGVEERACSAPWDHWMPVYAHYLFAGLRFPIPELLVGLLLDYGIGLTKLVPNAMRGSSRKDKGWYYFTPRVANRESRGLFMAGPSSIKGWKEKFFFVDDTEWERGDTEVRELASWKAKRANPNKFSLNEDKDEEVGKLLKWTKFWAQQEERPSPRSQGRSQGLQPNKWMKEELEKGGSAQHCSRTGGGGARAAVEKENLTLSSGSLRRGPRYGLLAREKGLVPLFSFQSSLFEAKNMMRARRFINTTFPEMDKRQARDEALRYCEASVVKHVLESASWVNGLAQEFMDSERASLSTKLVFEESKRRISESEREAQEHINNFISSSSFDNIVNLYWLPTTIIAFTDCRKKVKAEYPEVDITKITFGEQEEGFDFKFVAVEEKGAEVKEDEVEAGVEGVEVDENQLVPKVEIHPVPSDDEQPPLSDE
ncbi:hypothetical protein SLEP1_g3684 [Rubroshorea leprosula]|uniref:Uncharacterized protein n=1 Tax=Rubroshorea leprosula TaxID=152421 RepID=A0AAV5HL99_9ROSI|nr:hypothetical protein SLEP1_g3684 [Rubroshorea leprosula]